MASIFGAILGGVLGALSGDGFGAFAGALIGWLVVRSVRQQRELQALKRAFDEASRGAAIPSASPVPPVESPSAESAESAGEPPASYGTGAAAVRGTGAGAAPAAAAPVPVEALAMAEADPFWDTEPGREPVPPTPATAAGSAATARPFELAPAPPDLWAPIRRWLFGGNTIVKVGVGILFVGLAFLAKFASEHVHVPVEMRLAAIAGVAIALLFVGWRLRLRRPGYAQVLQGGAIAVLYLTLFVAFRFYGVLDALPVFALMVLVAALAAALAVLQDARALAVIGALGGFATPLLVSTGSGNHVALFSYYLVLDLGIAAVAWHKDWRALNLVGFFGTFVIATAWGVLQYRPENFASSEAFLIAFFLLFVAIMLFPARRLQGDVAPVAAGASLAARSDAWVASSLLFGLPTVVFALQYGLVRETPYGVSLSALVLAAFYVALAGWMRSRPQLGLTFDASLAIGTVFLTLVIPFALDARSTAGAWALEGAALVWIGLRQRRGLARGFGYALLALAGLSMLYGHERHGIPTVVFNAYLFNALLAAGASLAAALFVHRAAVSRDEAVAEPLLIGWAMVWLLSAAGLEIGTFVAARHALAAWLATISAIALLCVALSARLDWRNVAWPAVAHAPFLGVAALASAATLAGPFEAGGWWAWPVALAVHAAVLRFVATRWPDVVGHAVHALGALVVAGLGALEGRAITVAWGDAASAWAWLGWLVVPAALLIMLPRPSALRWWPIRAQPAAYRSTAAAVLTVGLLLWTLIANVASDGSAQPLPHLPLLNPLDLGIGVALFAAWAWMRSESAGAAFASRPQLPVAMLATAGFVWLNAMLVRGFHHYAGVPYRVDAWAASLAVQTGITLLWTVTALVLMWLSASRAARVAWMVGAGLLAAVVLKLLLIDLSGSGTVTRIVSFIGVGVLMLVIGYVAPLPAKEARHAAT